MGRSDLRSLLRDCFMELASVNRNRVVNIQEALWEATSDALGYMAADIRTQQHKSEPPDLFDVGEWTGLLSGAPYLIGDDDKAPYCLCILAQVLDALQEVLRNTADNEQ